MDKEAGRIKITVLKRFDTKDVFKDPPIKAKYSGPCPIFKEGQVFYVDDSMPSGFCPYAWGTIFPMIMTLRFGGNCSEWYDEPGVAVACCPDGLRPVIFKLERKQPDDSSTRLHKSSNQYLSALNHARVKQSLMQPRSKIYYV